MNSKWTQYVFPPLVKAHKEIDKSVIKQCQWVVKKYERNSPSMLISNRYQFSARTVSCATKIPLHPNHQSTRIIQAWIDVSSQNGSKNSLGFKIVTFVHSEPLQAGKQIAHNQKNDEFVFIS